MRWTALVVTVVIGCGDPEPPTCEVPAAELPTDGLYIDPYAFELPAACVEAGLSELPGRWFVRDPGSVFDFEYPAVEGSCSTGFSRVAGTPEDHDITDDGATSYNWSDGTRWFRRSERRYKLSDGSFYIQIDASVLCMLPDDTLAGTYVQGFSIGTDMYFDEWTAIGTRFGRMDEEAQGLELVGEIGTTPDGVPIFAVNLVVEGGYAYISAFSGFEIVDVNNPANPVPVGHVDGSYNDVRVVNANGKRYAILAPAGNGRTRVVDVTTPTAPTVVTVIDSYSHSLQVQQRGAVTELYLAGLEDVPAYDITNPASPIQMLSVPLQGMFDTHDLTVDGNMLYVNHGFGGFVAVDISAGNNKPVELARIPAPAYSHASWLGTANGHKVLLHGDEGLTATSDGGAFMRVYEGDRASPAFMTEIGRYQTRPEVGIHNIEMHGNLAYIAYYQDGVRIVDLTEPTNPIEIAHYNTWDPVSSYGDGFEGAVGIRLVDGYIYVADDVRGLLILKQTP
jgi:hypothetical protein